jgi:alpha-methylacyl-CoA racemase
LAAQWDRGQWPAAKQRVADRVGARSLDDWLAAFDGTESCVAPVLTLDEATRHPHLRARGTYVDVAGVTQPAPAPRFSATPSDTPKAFEPWSRSEANAILGPWLDKGRIAGALESGLFD